MSAKKTNSNKSEKKHRSRRGDGTIYQLSTTGKWVAQLKINGKRKTIATGDSYEEVKAKLDKAKVELRENSYIEKDNKTVGAILEENLRNKERSNKITPSTILRNRETAKVIFNAEISTMPIQKVERQDIQNFLNDIAETYSNSYIDKIYIQLSNCFATALDDGLIRKNLFSTKAITKPSSVKPDRIVDALTIEEHRAFLQQLEKKDYKYKDIFYVLFETGMRVGEVLALHRDNLDFKERVIHVERTLTRDSNDRPILGDKPKTNAGVRDVPLTDHLIRIFKRNMNLKFLFTKPDGSFISTSTINTHFKKICKDAGIRVYVYEFKRNGKTVRLNSSRVTTHQIRHTFGTRCIEQGMSHKALQAIMGHSDISITMNTYVSADDNFKADQMKMVELNLKAINLM